MLQIIYLFFILFLKLQLNLRTPFTNFCLGNPARSSKTFTAVSLAGRRFCDFCLSSGSRENQAENFGVRCL
ncbi:MAG: hypothetical protein PUI79_02955, partial [Campylobacteraceae bacterium]|nr:hypothetical protein [Campylobacteraceae bacterium]